VSATPGVRLIRDGVAGRIRLERRERRNALTRAMVRAIEAALAAWATDDAVAIVMVEADGPLAFCAGADLRDLACAAAEGGPEAAAAFWRETCRMVARLHEFPKPVVSFLHGLTLGEGVGLGCLADHRIAGESLACALPAVAIGFVPAAGGSLLLARAPGRSGEYLALTGERMDPADAIHAGFADVFVPEADWPDLKAGLAATGNWKRIADAGRPPPGEGRLAALRDRIDALFAGETAADILRLLRATPGDAFAAAALAAIAGHAPLAMAAAVEMIHRLRGSNSLRRALELEFRYAARAMAQGDFPEGIRARLLDRDGAPRWRHAEPEAVPLIDLARMLMPLPPGERLDLGDAGTEAAAGR
jgi:enoyl-CoA hydratase/carnithine racemase